MACEDFENQISDYLDNQLPPADRTRVAAHLAGCADCRAFAQLLEQLDMELSRTVNAPTLSADFGARLQQQVQTIVVLSESHRAERKRQLQAEYEAGMARLNRFSLPPRQVLESLGYVGLLSFAGWLAWLFLPQLANLLAGPSLGGSTQSLLFPLVTSAIFVAIGLAAAFPRQVKQRLGLPGMLRG